MRRFKQTAAWLAIALCVSLIGSQAMAGVIPAGLRPIWGIDFTQEQTSTNFGQGTLTNARATTRTVYRDGAWHDVAIATPAFGDNGLSIAPATTNYFLASATPANQDINLGTGTFCLWIEGITSAEVAANTATITGAGTATAGSPVTFVVTGAGTVTITITGSPTHCQVQNGSVPGPKITTTVSAVSIAADANLFTTPTAVKNLLSTEQPAPTSLDSEASGDIVLSTVAGTAFAMPDDGSSADLSGHVGRVLKVVDSAGKVAWGWVGAVGTGETLGSELVSDPGFGSAGDWAASAGWAVGGGVATATTTTGNLSNTSGTKTTYNGLFKCSIYVASRTAGAVIIRYPQQGPQTGPGDSVQYINEQYSTTAFPMLQGVAGGFSGTVDSLSVKQVTAPPATGCTIVSTPGGSTQNWAYIQSGFNPNAITTWDVYAASDWQAQGTLVVRGWVPGFSYGDAGTDIIGIVSPSDVAQGMLFARSGRFRMQDDTTDAYGPAADNWSTGESWDIAARWSSITNLMQVGTKLSSASTWTWGSAAAFDGAFTLGASLNIGYSPSYPFEIGKVQFFNSWLSEAQLAWMDSLTEWVACAGDYIYGQVAGM